MINEARYSFLCQFKALSLIQKEKEFYYHPLCFQNTLESIMLATTHGTHVLIEDPEAIAEKLDDKEILKDRGIPYNGPRKFPYEFLCLWHTPKVFDPSMGKAARAKHLICVHRISSYLLYINYACCYEDKKVDRIGGELDFSWEIIPYGVLLTIPPNTLFETPALPLPGVLENNVRLRKKIIEAKTGEKEASILFIDLLKKGSGEDLTLATRVLIPGVFQVLFGFLGHLMTQTLVQHIGFDGKLIITDSNGGPPEIIPDVTYQKVTCK